MKKTNLVITLAATPLLLAGCGKTESGSSSSSTDEITDASEISEAFGYFKATLSDLFTHENQGWHYDQDPSLGKNDRDFSFDIYHKAQNGIDGSSSAAATEASVTQIGLDAESGDFLVNAADAPNLKLIEGAFSLNRAYVYGIDEDETGQAGGGALYLPLTKGYLKQGVGYLDISKDSSLKTAADSYVHTQYPGNDDWQVPDRIKRTLPDVATWLSLRLTSDGPAFVSNLTDNLEALQKKNKGDVTFTKKDGVFSMHLSVDDVAPVYKAVDDLFTSSASGKAREYLYDWKESVTDFSLTGTLDYSSSVFLQASLKNRIDNDPNKLVASFPDQEYFITSFSGNGIYTPLSDDSAAISFPDLSSFEELPPIAK